MTAIETMTFDMERYIKSWMRCHDICLETMNYCKSSSGSRDTALMCMLRDCAEMCLMCVHLMNDGSEFVGRTSVICAEMCEKCAAACEQMKGDARRMECASICRSCAESLKAVGRLATAYFRRPSFVAESLLSYSPA